MAKLLRHGHRPFWKKRRGRERGHIKHGSRSGGGIIMEAEMHGRAIRWTFGAAALIGSVTAIGASASSASAATNPKISGLIWSDTNANNTRETGEPGARGKRVVVKSTDPERPFWASRTTGTSGWWGVVVPPGCYNIKYDFPDRLGTLKFDATDPFDSDPGVGAPLPGTAGYVTNVADTLTHTAHVCVTAANETTYASIPPNEWHRLTLQTWLDKNRDGIRQSGEPGVANVTNQPTRWRFSEWASNHPNWARKTTDASGTTTWWLPAGSCGAINEQFPVSPIYGHTKSNVGSDSTDSDFVNENPGPIFCVGRTDVTLGSGLIDLSTKPQPDALTITGRVWIDTNKNGRQDAGEPNAPDGMEITTSDSRKYSDCPATATAKTVGGRYTLVTGRLINCRVWLDHGFDNDNGDFIGPIETVQLARMVGTSWAATLANVGSDTGDSDGKFFRFYEVGCGDIDITCADLPATGVASVTIDFGIVRA